MEVGEFQGTEMGFVCDKPYVVFSLSVERGGGWGIFKWLATLVFPHLS